MQVLRYVAFSSDPAGGNPAGVVLDASGAGEGEMLAVAAALGYSETAFLVPRGDRHFGVRYFSPLAEVPFCGHATIASAVAYVERHGPGQLRFETPAGWVDIANAVAADGAVTATLTSVPPRVEPFGPTDRADLLAALRWGSDDLDAALPPRLTFAGAWHPVLAAGSRERLADLDYDRPALGGLMARRGWTTINLIWRASELVFFARNPFPPGGIFEDPATGAAAAALGGYLRELGLVTPPASVTVHQGDDLGRPGLLTVGIPVSPETGIAVSGTAVAL
ncbi:MAG: PhzF family phenazine biosynthesis protein [Frankia sp.]